MSGCDVMALHVHRPPMWGIHGRAVDGCESVCENGGYEDDEHSRAHNCLAELWSPQLPTLRQRCANGSTVASSSQKRPRAFVARNAGGLVGMPGFMHIGNPWSLHDYV